MPRMHARSFVIAIAALIGVTGGTLAGCGDDAASTPDAPMPDAFVAPAFRNPRPDLTDEQLATQSLQMLGASVEGAVDGTCGDCHGVTKQKLRYWRALSDTSLATCLSDLAISSVESARETIRCMRELEMETADFEAKKLGIFAVATKLPWFAALFDVAYGDEGPARLAEFQASAGMPKPGFLELTQDQFDVVAEWFARGLPMLDDTLRGDPPPTTCESGVSADVAVHVTAMRTSGWKALDRAAMMAMHGCAAGAATLDCLSSYPLASSTDYGATWDHKYGPIRVLKEHAYASAYWTRSSPDGRFVAHGVAGMAPSAVYDLQRSEYVQVNAKYDPAFFPDNTGFVFQGGQRNICPVSVLTSNPSTVTMQEPGCRRIDNLGLYQHVGRGIGANADYFNLDNKFESDDGGKSPTLGDPMASFDQGAYSSFSALVFNGTQYNLRGTVDISTPFEGDTVLSHSSGLTMARVAGPGDRQIGYVLRKVITTPSDSSYAYTAPEVARYCFSGGKVGFSFDERWVAFHHYVTDADAVELGFSGPNDPGFAPYRTLGAANIYLLELTTGVRERLTNMAPGQYALYPHFRADDWMYAQVRDLNTDMEYTIAHPAAVVLDSSP